MSGVNGNIIPLACISPLTIILNSYQFNTYITDITNNDLPWRIIVAAIAVGIPTVFAIAVYPFISPYDTRVINFFSYRLPGHKTPML